MKTLYHVTLGWKYNPPGDRKPYYATADYAVVANDRDEALARAARDLERDTVTGIRGTAREVYTGRLVMDLPKRTTKARVMDLPRAVLR